MRKKNFEVIITENDKGEMELEIIDYVAKTKSFHSADELNKLPKNPLTAIWCADKCLEFAKKAYRGSGKTEVDDGPF